MEKMENIKDVNDNMSTIELKDLLCKVYNSSYNSNNSDLLSNEDLDKAFRLINNLKKTNETLFDRVLELEGRLEDIKTVFDLEFSY